MHTVVIVYVFHVDAEQKKCIATARYILHVQPFYYDVTIVGSVLLQERSVFFFFRDRFRPGFGGGFVCFLPSQTNLTPRKIFKMGIVLVSVLSGIVAFIAMYIFNAFRRRKFVQLIDKIPGPPAIPVFGNVHQFPLDRVGT